MNDIDPADLRRKLLVNPEEALKILSEKYRNKLVACSRAYTGNLEASEDIVQDAFVIVWLSHQVIGKQHEKSVLQYIIKIVKYRSIDFFNDSIKKKNEHLKYQSMFSPTAEPADALLLALEHGVEIRKIFSGFSTRERECFLMQADEKLRVKEIAKKLNISVKAVEWNLTNARKRFKRMSEMARIAVARILTT